MANFCKHCGTPLEPDSMFCANCGTPITSPHQDATKTPPTEPLSPAETMQQNSQSAHATAAVPVQQYEPAIVQQSQQPAPFPQTKLKKKKVLIIGVTAIVVMLAAVVILLIILLSPKSNEESKTEPFTADYTLVSMTQNDEDYIASLCYEKMMIPAKLHLSDHGKGMLYSSDGKEIAELEYDEDNQSGTLTNTESSEPVPVSVSVEDQILTIVLEEDDLTVRYRLQDDDILKEMSGKYVIASSEDIDHDNLLEYSAAKGDWMVNQLTMNDDGTGSILYEDDDQYAELSLKPDDMSGMITYTYSGQENQVFASYDDDSITIYDMYYREVDRFIKIDTIDLSEAEGTYTLIRFYSGDFGDPETFETNDESGDCIDFYNKNGWNIPHRLTMDDKGNGTIENFGSSVLFADFSIDRNSMSAPMHYYSENASINDRTAILTYHDDTIVIYDGHHHIAFYYSRKPQDYIFALLDSEDSVEGKLTEFKTKEYDDYAAQLKKTNKPVPQKVVLNSNGNGKVLNEDGTTRFSFIFSDGTIYKDFLFTAEDKTLSIYDTVNYCTYRFSFE